MSETARILQYELPEQTRFALTMPRYAQILGVGRQGRFPCMWVSADELQRPEERIFRAMAVGEFFDAERYKFVGHIQMGPGEDGWHDRFIWEVDMGLARLVPDTIGDKFPANVAESRNDVTDAVARERTLVAV